MISWEGVVVGKEGWVGAKDMWGAPPTPISDSQYHRKQEKIKKPMSIAAIRAKKSKNPCV